MSQELSDTITIIKKMLDMNSIKVIKEELSDPSEVHGEIHHLTCQWGDHKFMLALTDIIEE